MNLQHNYWCKAWHGLVSCAVHFSAKKSVRGGLIIVGEINLGGSIEPIHNPVTIAEIAVEKGATALLMPAACRRQLFDLSDDMATKIDIQFYSDARDALLRTIVE
ncbi:ATP-dependent Lon protease [Nitrosomonas sp. Nm33]|nr:ATP-dependent Lon protease [Nitrosomonas sp. Nm33]